MTQYAKQAKKSRSFTVGVSFRLTSYYSLLETLQCQVRIMKSSEKQSKRRDDKIEKHLSREAVIFTDFSNLICCGFLTIGPTKPRSMA